ncbi:hypothetical protein BDZ97DRAFT_1833376, partial [Flammula alnicola]
LKGYANDARNMRDFLMIIPPATQTTLVNPSMDDTEKRSYAVVGVGTRAAVDAAIQRIWRAECDGYGSPLPAF